MLSVEAAIDPPLFVIDRFSIDAFVFALIRPPSFFSVPPAMSRSALDSSLPPVLSSVLPTVAAKPVWLLITPAALFSVPVRAATRPLLMTVPPTFDTRPVPLSMVNVPLPACVIVPPSLTMAAAPSNRSVLLLCNVPPFELSSVPDTFALIAAVPVCVIVPPWFTRSVALNDSCVACTAPRLLSRVVPVNVAVWPAIEPPLLVRRVPASTATFCAACKTPLALATDCPETCRFALDVILPWFATLPPCTVTSPLPPMTPPCAPFAVVPAALVNSPPVVTVRPSLLSDVIRPAVLSSDAPAIVIPAALWMVPRLFAMAPPRTATVLSDTSSPDWLAIWPATLTDSCPCDDTLPPWFDRLPPVSVVLLPLDRLPWSLITVPDAFA
ncbi:hypothetical protein FEP58_04147 [Burkholderia multivorans]|nr:hypothetical protein [Burkholderia multivorans]